MTDPREEAAVETAIMMYNMASGTAEERFAEAIRYTVRATIRRARTEALGDTRAEPEEWVCGCYAVGVKCEHTIHYSPHPLADFEKEQCMVRLKRSSES